MIAALFVYVLCAISGCAAERRIEINSLIKRLLLTLAIAAGQLMVAIEILSLARALTGSNLIIANLVLTTLVVLLTKRVPLATRLSWRELFTCRLAELGAAPKDFATIALLIVSATLFFFAAAAGRFLIPFNDSYHFEMPIFWAQRRTILPFPMFNPRVPALSFLSEAITLPGYLYAKSILTTHLFAIFTGVLVLWTVFSLARRVGADLATALCVVAATVGLTSVTGNLYQSGAEMFFAGAFVGGSVLFLLDLRSADAKCSPNSHIACSVLLFAMACGAKNSTALLGPAYLILLILTCKKVASSRTSLAKIAAVALAAGAVGLLISGAGWNYASNKLWFAESGMPRVIRETVSQNFSAREIWTRVTRGGVLLASDTMWLPGSIRQRYAAAAEGAVKILGAKKTLPEDTSFYFFDPAPGKGLGILGAAILVPALALGMIVAIRAFKKQKALSATCFNITVLTLFALTAFLMCHLILRWQSLGVLRLIFPFTALAAPLMAFLLCKPPIRYFALTLLICAAGILSIFWIATISRRYDFTNHPAIHKIARLQKDHSYVVQYAWDIDSLREQRIREGYSNREIHELILTRLQQPATLGVVGHGNTESIFLFGDQFQNRIIPLVDCRQEEKILDRTAADLDYIIVLDKFAEGKSWAEKRGFKQIFTASRDQTEVALVFKRRARSP